MLSVPDSLFSIKVTRMAPNILLAAGVALILGGLYAVIVVVYRLHVHPLAGIPGPKLAAITGWYEAYYELFHRGLGGQYTFHIRELHKKYGPIVRISPREVHIDDPEFYSTIYTNKHGLDKPEYLRWRFGAPSALFSTPEHRVHRMRRAAQEPFFAKRRIQELAPKIQAKVDQMCARLAQDFAGQGPDRPVTLDKLFASYVADVTTKYSFDQDFEWLAHTNFDSPFIQAIRSFKDIAHPCTQFPWLARALAAIPPSVVRILQPSMSCVLDFQEEMCRLIRRAQDELATKKSVDPGKTIVHGILRSGLPTEELRMEVLKDHAVSLVGAGIASTQWTLTIACFHIISDGRVHAKLKEELRNAMADPDVPAPLDAVLEKLPYLTACVEEGT
jgi:cytochrome P450